MTMKAVAAAAGRIADYAKQLEEQTREIGDDHVKREEWARRAHLEFLQLLVDSVDAFTKAENALAANESDFMKAEWRRLRLMAYDMKKRAQVRAPATENDFSSALIYIGERGTANDLSFLSKVEDDPPLDSKEAVDLIRQTRERIIEIASTGTARSENKDFQKAPDAGYNATVATPNDVRPAPHTLCRIFCPAEEQDDLPPEIRKIEAYESFVVGQAPDVIIDQLRFRYPVETITQVVTHSPKEARMREKVIKFRAPVKESWKRDVISAGATILEPMGREELLVSVPNDIALARIRDLEQVISVEDYQPRMAVKILAQEADGCADEPLREDGTPTAPHARILWDFANYADTFLPGILIARFFDSQYREAAEKLLLERDIAVLGCEGTDRLVIDALSSRDISTILKAIHSLPGLRSVEEKTLETPSNDQARGVICTGVVLDCENAHPAADPNLCLDGSDEIVAIADTGLDTGDQKTLHLDFRGRVKDILSYPIDESWKWALTNAGADGGAADINTGHGTHVAGSLMGSGDQAKELGLQQKIRGVAPAAQLIFQSIEQTPQWNATIHQRAAQQGIAVPGPSITFGIPDDLKDLFQPCYDVGVRIHSNSWGKPDPSGYGDRSYQLDSFVWDHRDFLVVVAAGNRAVASNGCIEPMSVESPGTAKNCLTVGATENDRAGEFAETYGDRWPDRFPDPPFKHDGVVDHVDDIAAFSARGHCHKNARRKPDVVAPGTYVLSTRSSLLPADVVGWRRFDSAPDHYMFNGGTSMAAPLVAGCAALIRQFLRQYKGMPNPSAALVKAAIIHSARYRRYRHRHPSAYPWADHEQGWGRVDLKRLLRTEARCNVEFFDETPGIETGQRREFKVRVDDPSVPLRVTLAYSDHPGLRLINNLNLQVSDPRKGYYLGNDFQHTGAIDHNNNVEGIIVMVPQPGEWTIKVVASEVQVGPQDFALIVSGGITRV